MRKQNSLTKKQQMEVVCDAYVLGMGLNFISEALDILLQDVKHWTQEVKNHPNRPRCVDERFWAILKRYAQLIISQQLDSCETALQNICANWLRIGAIQQRIENLDMTIDRLSMSQYPPDSHPYISLFWALIGKNSKEDFQSKWTEFLLSYCHKLTTGETERPSSRKAWEEELHLKYLESQWYRSIQLPIDEVKRLTSEAISKLRPKQQETVLCRFGFIEGKMTLLQVGESMSLSREGVRQKELTALRFLKHPSLIQKLKSLTHYQVNQTTEYSLRMEEKENYIAYLGKTIRELREENKRLRTQLRRDEERTVTDRNILTQLVRPVTEIRFPARAERFLREEKIRFLGELVQRTNQEILEARSLGTKSLKEIRDILQDLGLDTGMCLSPELKEELENLIHPKRKQG